MGKAAQVRKLFTSGGQYRWIAAQTKRHLPRIAFLMTFNIAASLLSVWLVAITKTIYSIAVGDVAASIVLWIGIYVVVGIVNLALSSLGSAISVSAQEKLAFGIRSRVFEKLLRARWLDVSKYHTGDLQTRITSDISAVTNSVVSILPSLVSLVTTFAAAFFSLYRESPFLAYSTVLLVPIVIVMTRVIGRRLGAIQKKVQESESLYRAYTQECLINLPIIKSFSYQGQSVEKLSELQNKRFVWVVKRNRLSIFSGGVFSLGYMAGYSVALAWGASQVMSGAITLPVMMQFTLLVSMIQSPIIGLSRTIPQIITTLASVDRLMELESLPGENYGCAPEVPESLDIVLDNVGFSYREGEPVLLSCDMTLHSGDMAALTGLSGVGKTTLVRMLLLLIEPDTGKMSIRTKDGTDVKFNAALRDWIAYVPQGNTLFSGTIAENLRIGKQNAGESEMRNALLAADALDFVDKLPDKLDTAIGEKGLGLSEGQAQRIAIARALIRDAPIVILDEATSALDEKTELVVLDNISKRAKNAVCLVITHRSSALKFCNRRFEMNNGTLKEVINN